jgi:hypothetical protein
MNEIRTRYADGAEVVIGDDVHVLDTGENCQVCEIGRRGYLAVTAPAWRRAPTQAHPRVFHVTEIGQGHVVV